MTAKKEVDRYLHSVSADRKVGHECEIASAISAIIERFPDNEEQKEGEFDAMAFYCYEEKPRGFSGQEIYYDGFHVNRNKEEEIIKSPVLRKTAERILNYWAARAKENLHPVLASRYADLVVDISPRILRKSADVEMFLLVIDNNIAIQEKSLMSDYDCMVKINRAISLAIKIKDSARIEKAKTAMMRLHENVQDEPPGPWSRAFDAIMLQHADKINLSAHEKENMLSKMEMRLKSTNSFWHVEGAVRLLAEFYARNKDEDNLMRVSSVYEAASKNDPRADSSALLKHFRYNEMRKFYQKYSDRGFASAKKAAARVSREIQQLDLDWGNSMKVISVKTEISNDDIKEWLNGIFGQNKNVPINAIMARIVRLCLVSKETLEKSFNSARENFLYMHLTSQVVVSDDGFTAGTRPNSDNKNFLYSRHAGEYIKLSSVYLGFALAKFREIYSTDLVMGHLRQTLLFNEEGDVAYMTRAVCAYWDEDYLVASHLFIPLIESAIRKLIKLTGGKMTRRNNLEGVSVCTLGSLINDNRDIFRKVFGSDDVAEYFFLVLCDLLALNLRNDFAHGLSKKAFLDVGTSDLLFHIIIILSFVLPKKDDAA